jgi:hypothetical protein
MGKMKNLFMIERENQSLNDDYLDDSFHYDCWLKSEMLRSTDGRNFNSLSERKDKDLDESKKY